MGTCGEREAQSHAACVWVGCGRHDAIPAANLQAANCWCQRDRGCVAAWLHEVRPGGVLAGWLNSLDSSLRGSIGGYGWITRGGSLDETRFFFFCHNGDLMFRSGLHGWAQKKYPSVSVRNFLRLGIPTLGFESLWLTIRAWEDRDLGSRCCGELSKVSTAEISPVQRRRARREGRNGRYCKWFLGTNCRYCQLQVSNRMGERKTLPYNLETSMQDDDLSSVSVDGHGTKKYAQTDGTGGGYAVRTCLLPT